MTGRFDTLEDAQMIAGLTIGGLNPCYVESASLWLKSREGKRQMVRSAIISRAYLVKLGVVKSRRD